MLTAQQIREKDDFPVKRVDTPEWGEDEFIYVRRLSGSEANKLRTMSDDEKFLGLWAALLGCDEHGNRLFTDEDAQWLAEKNLVTLNRICDVGQCHNGMDRDTNEQAKKN